MMVFKKSLPLAAALLAPASLVTAHSGHDHGHWTSPVVHSFILWTLVSAIAIGIWFYRRKLKILKLKIRKNNRCYII